MTNTGTVKDFVGPKHKLNKDDTKEYAKMDMESPGGLNTTKWTTDNWEMLWVAEVEKHNNWLSTSKQPWKCIYK